MDTNDIGEDFWDYFLGQETITSDQKTDKDLIEKDDATLMNQSIVVDQIEHILPQYRHPNIHPLARSDVPVDRRELTLEQFVCEYDIKIHIVKQPFVWPYGKGYNIDCFNLYKSTFKTDSRYNYVRVEDDFCSETKGIAMSNFMERINNSNFLYIKTCYWYIFNKYNKIPVPYITGCSREYLNSIIVEDLTV